MLKDGKVKAQFLNDNRPANKIDFTGTTVVNDGNWHHVALTYDGSSNLAGTQLYVDGNLEAKTATTNTLTGSILNDVNLVLGSRAGGLLYNGQMDDFRLYDYALSSAQINDIANPQVELQLLLQVSGIDLTTPSTTLSNDKTEALVDILFDVTHSSASVLTGDGNALMELDNSVFTLNEEDSSISTVGNPLDNTKTILGATVPIISTTAQTASIGTINIPLTSTGLISSVDKRDDPSATSTLLNAKAQAVRYALFVHSIGGSSGQAELRGNDEIIALGVGFTENNPNHAGTEGTDDEIAGTYLHETAHLLNIQHGGPAYEITNPSLTFEETKINCVPVSKSVMTYVGQLPGYLGADWALRFNTLDGLTFSEDTFNEKGGISLSGSPLIAWGTPNSVTSDFLTGYADGSDLDFDGDLTITDSSSIGYDLNNFGISGCEASPGETYKLFSEPKNFDFAFQNGPNGQFDGYNPEPLGETTGNIRDQQRLSGADFELVPPPALDGTEVRKAGSNLPLKVKLFLNLPDGSIEYINDARIRADLVRESGSTSTLGYFEYSSSNDQYQLQWNTKKNLKGESAGVRYIIEILQKDPDGIPFNGDNGETFRERLLVILENDPILKVGDKVVTVKVTWE
jgi:hypothetical protein